MGGLGQLLLGLAAGWASLPAWTALAAASALLLGVPLGAPVTPGATPLAVMLVVVAAPVAEELLYRGVLLGSLRARIGALPALALTSSLFAAAHGEPRLVVATFLVGTGLGALRLAGASLALLIGLHAGLNLGVLTCGLPLRDPALPPGAGALLAAALTALAWAIAPGSAGRGAWRLRAAAFALSAIPVSAIRATELAAPRREALLWAVLVAVGWGHLTGAALLAWPRIRARFGADVPASLAAAFCGVLVVSLFVAYLWLLPVAPVMVIPLLAASAWHTAENELVLGAAWRRGGRAPAFGRGAAGHLPGVAAAAGLALVFLSAGAGRVLAPGLPLALPVDLSGWLDFSEIFVLLGLQHVLSWALLLARRVVDTLRSAGRRDAARQAAHFAALHVVPALGCGLLLALPDARLDGLRAWVFSPAVYLFASALHVAHTAWLRRA